MDHHSYEHELFKDSKNYFIDPWGGVIVKNFDPKRKKLASIMTRQKMSFSFQIDYVDSTIDKGNNNKTCLKASIHFIIENAVY